jgi:uncharacterized membrane protein
LKPLESRYALSVIVLAGFALRLVNLGAESYWFDEIWAIKQVQSPLGGMMQSLALEDVHPPLYPLLLWGWVRLVGEGEWATRFLSCLFSTGAIWAIYALGRSLYDRRVGLAAAALMACQGFAVFYAQESRAYSLLLFTSLFATYRLLKWRSNPPSKKALALYLVGAVLLAYSHVYGLFLLIAHGIWVLGWVPELRKPILVVGALVLVCFSPWLPVFLSQIGRVEQGFWIDPPTLIDLPKWLYYWAGYNPVAITVFALLIYLGARHTEARATLWLMGLWVLLLVVVPLLLSLLSTPIFHHKYAIAILAPLCLLSARGFVALRPDRQALSAVAIVLLLVGGIVWQLYLKPNKEQWRELAQIGEAAHSSGQIVAADTFNRPYLPYYLRDTPVFWVKNEADLNALEGIARHRSVEFVYLQVHPPNSPQSKSLDQRFERVAVQLLHRAQAVRYRVKALQRHTR